MKNSFFAASLAAMLLPSAALGQQSQSEDNAQTGTGPAIYKPLSDRVVGHVMAFHTGATEVIVYEGTGQAKTLEVQPYFGIFMEDLHALAKTCAEAGVASVPFNIRLETWRRDAMEKAIIESKIDENLKSHTVKQLGVYQLILKTKDGRVLYKRKKTIEDSFPSLMNFDGSKNSHTSGKDTPCPLVKKIVQAPRDELSAQVIVPSDNATTEFNKVTIAYELQQKLREELDKIEDQQGLRRTENKTLVGSEQSSVDTNKSVIGAEIGIGGSVSNRELTIKPELTIGSTILGNVKQKFDSTNTTTREDTRRRYIDLEGMKGFVRSSRTHIVNRSYCIRTTENDCSKNLEHLAEMILEILQTDRLQVFRESPADGFREAYILIKDRDAVDEAFSAGMKPHVKTSQSAKMQCAPAMELLEKATRVGAAVYTGGVSEVPVALADEKSKKGAEDLCGNDRDMTISDENDVEWKYVGREWVPTSMRVAYVSNDDISSVVDITTERTVSDGGISLELMEIPLVLLDGQYNDGQYNEMDARIYKMDARIYNLERLIRELLKERNRR